MYTGIVSFSQCYALHVKNPLTVVWKWGRCQRRSDQAVTSDIRSGTYELVSSILIFTNTSKLIYWLYSNKQMLFIVFNENPPPGLVSKLPNRKGQFPVGFIVEEHRLYQVQRKGSQFQRTVLTTCIISASMLDNWMND